MDKKIINTENAPQAIGPYSQGVKVGDFIFFSGQIPLDAKTGALIGGSIEEEAHQVFKNIGALLKACDLDYKDVVKATVFMTDLGNFIKVNEIYASYFTGDFPARSAVQVAALPKGANLEIEVIACAK